MSKKLSYEYVKEYIENQKYVLLSKEYTNNYTKLKIQCDKGHEFNMSFNCFKTQNQRCKQCYYEIPSKSKFTYEYVKNYIENEGYKLLSKKYKSKDKKIEVICPEGHVYKVTFGNFKNRKSRCNKCLSIRYSKDYKLSYDIVKKRIEKIKGYKLLSTKYKNHSTKLKIKCPKGHKFEMLLWNFTGLNHRCPKCLNQSNSSKPEKIINRYIKHVYKNRYNKNDRGIIKNPHTNYSLEFDFYFPLLKKAIEFNGVYWHSLEKVKERDKIKINECKKQDIDLLVINENNWVKNKHQCLLEIKKYLTGE